MKLSFKIVSLVLVMSLTCSPLIFAQVTTTVCRHCGNYIASSSTLCPTCGKNPKSPTGDPFWGLLYYSVVEYENQKLKGSTNQKVKKQSRNKKSSQRSKTLQRGIVNDPTDDYVNVRSGPGTKYNVLTTLNVGENVLYEPSTSHWLKVYYEDGSFMGWIFHNRVH